MFILILYVCIMSKEQAGPLTVKSKFNLNSGVILTIKS